MDESRSTRSLFAIDGHFEAREVEAGFYLVHAFSPALAIRSQTAEAVDLEDGGTATVHVRLQ